MPFRRHGAPSLLWLGIRTKEPSPCLPVSSPVEGEKLVRIDLSPFGVPLARRTIAPLVPKAGVAAMPHHSGGILIPTPPGIMPAEILAGLAGLFLSFHFSPPSPLYHNKNQ